MRHKIHIRLRLYSFSVICGARSGKSPTRRRVQYIFIYSLCYNLPIIYVLLWSYAVSSFRKVSETTR